MVWAAILLTPDLSYTENVTSDLERSLLNGDQKLLESMSEPLIQGSWHDDFRYFNSILPNLWSIDMNTNLKLQLFLKSPIELQTRNRDKLLDELRERLDGQEVPTDLLYAIWGHQQELLSLIPSQLQEEIKDKFRKDYEEYKRYTTSADVSEDEARDILNHESGLTDFQNGEYHNTPRVYVFCRHTRSYHCRMLIKDIHGNFLRQE